jgi:hypothetical protein
MMFTSAAPSVAAGETENRSAGATTLAVVGDTPYGTDQEARFGELVGAVNADPKVRLAIHLGDLKSGSVTCSDERLAAALASFESFEDPLVYTPGDNDWTDCHRVNNGAYDPLERLDRVRELFFADPGRTLGRRPTWVERQPGLVENVRWVRSRVAFATLHVVGSDNGLAPRIGLGQARPTPAQAEEVQARIAATLSWVDQTFDLAVERGLPGVVLAMQADTWDPQPTSAQQAVVDRIAARTSAYSGQVLLLQGDSHVFTADNPLDLPNVTRIVVHGETLPFAYLRLTVDPRSPELFTWQRVVAP